MQKGNAVPENTYHIGDQSSDTEAAKRAGIHSIGAAWAATDPAALLASKPDHYFETVSDLAGFISRVPAG
jgi:phosphoglycolate phosphatase-like HAD superfamily hydrolase